MLYFTIANKRYTLITFDRLTMISGQFTKFSANAYYKNMNMQWLFSRLNKDMKPGR